MAEITSVVGSYKPKRCVSVHILPIEWINELKLGPKRPPPEEKHEESMNNKPGGEEGSARIVLHASAWCLKDWYVQSREKRLFYSWTNGLSISRPGDLPGKDSRLEMLF